MPATIASGQPPTVDPPKHSLPALATFELDGYRRQLENAIAFFGSQDPVPAVLGDLQATLNDVIAEHESRARIAGARTETGRCPS